MTKIYSQHPKSQVYPESIFGGFSDIDGTVIFYNRVNALIEQSFTILDIGCGRGASDEDGSGFRRNLRNLRGKCSQVIGIDVDPIAQNNPFIDDFKLITTDANWPVMDCAVDLAVCDNVIEHIKDINLFFNECNRVLKPGGFLCIRTTNLLGYVAMTSRIIPNKYHQSVLKKSQSFRKSDDIFPAYYNCNTISRLRNQMKRVGFTSVIYGYNPEPSYFEFNEVLYGLFRKLHKFIPNKLAMQLFLYAQKPS